MKLRELISKINKSKQFRDEVSITEIAEKEFNLYDIYDYGNQIRLVAYFYGSWYCTDTYVGFKVYFLDDEAVAVTYQGARKSSEGFTWISKETYIKVRNYILSFQEENERFSIDTCSLDEEIGETYKISFNVNLFDYHKDIPLLQGEKVKIIEADTNEGRGLGINEIVTIEHADKRTEKVDVERLDFPFNIVE